MAFKMASLIHDFGDHPLLVLRSLHKIKKLVFPRMSLAFYLTLPVLTRTFFNCDVIQAQVRKSI